MYVCVYFLHRASGWLLWILLAAWPAGADVATEAVPPDLELQLHHGVYFRPMGEVIVTGSDWTVCTSIILESYEEAHTSLISQIDRMEAQVGSLGDSFGSTITPKSKMFLQLQNKWDKLAGALRHDLANYLETLTIVKRTVVQNESRQSRGLINVVSNVGKYLFGFSTDSDVQNMAKRIDELASQGNNLVHQSDQQFSYIKSVATQTLHNGEQINRLHESMAGLAGALQAFQNTTTDISSLLKFAGMGLELLTAVELIRVGFSQSQEGLLTLSKIIAKSGEGRLAWELFEDSAFRALLGDLGDQLPTGWKLLYDAEDHYSYLHYITTETHRTARGLNLCMAIPIIKDSSRYQLYEAISMPIVHPNFPEKLFFSYKFDATYLAIQRNGVGHFTAQSGPAGTPFFTMGHQREVECIGKDPRVCSLYGAVTTPSEGQYSCLYNLFSNQPSADKCPVQVQYQDGPLFRHVGLGVWLYGAAQGIMQVRCPTDGGDLSQAGQYQLTGTGTFRLRPGCEAALGNIRVPSYVNGQGQFKIDLPDKPIVNLFSMNLTLSVWSNITSGLTIPDNITAFLHHLSEKSDIKKTALDLTTFNDTIHQYESMRRQLPPYHPFVWASRPEGQVAGFVLLLIFNLVTTMLFVMRLRKLHLRMNSLDDAPAAASGENGQLMPVRRRRRRRTADQVV